MMPDGKRARALKLVVPVAALVVAGAGLLAIATESVLAVEVVVPISLLLLVGGIFVLAQLVEGTRTQTEQRALEEREARARQILDRAHEAYIAMDHTGVVTAWNSTAETMFGWTREEAIGRTVADLIVPPGVQERHLRGVERFREHRYGPMVGRRMEVIGMHRDGGEIPVEISITVVDEPDGAYSFHGFVRDITERRLLEAQQAELLEEAKESARIDPLTSLPNRRGWDESLTREIGRARREKTPLCVAVLDLDHFKRFNDAHGHQAGDRLLRRAGSAWKLALRQSDLIARYGGEEFAVLLPTCDLDEAMIVIERLREVTPEHQTVSAGVAEWNGYETTDAMIDRADLALYNAKRGGRDRANAAA